MSYDNITNFDGIVLETGTGSHIQLPIYKKYQTVFSNLHKAYEEEELVSRIYGVDVSPSSPIISIKPLDANFGADGIVEALISSGISASVVYHVMKDMRKTEEISRREFLKKILKNSALFTTAAWFSPLGYLPGCLLRNKGEANEVVSKAVSAKTHTIPIPTTQGRNSINARKIEEFVSPHLRRILNLQRKPNVAMAYGFGHAGLEDDLKSKELRDFYIDIYSNTGYPGIDKNSLNVITEIIPAFHGWDFKEYEENLFHY